MGRTAKHTTDADRQAAKRSNRAHYRSTEKAKMLRSVQNRRAYEKCRPFKYYMRLFDIPKFVTKLGANPLPFDAPLFQQCFKNKGVILSTNEFEIWDKDPPYTVSSHLLELGLDETRAAIDGHRLRDQFEGERERISMYRPENHAEVWYDLHQTLLRYLTRAKSLKNKLYQFKESSIDRQMGQHLLYWEARRILALVEDWKALKAGKEDIVGLHRRRWENMGMTLE